MSMMKNEPYATYNVSSIFGGIPAGWDENALKRFCIRITDGAHTSPDLDESGKPFLSVVDLRNGELDFSLCKYTSLKDYESLVRNGCRPFKGDLLYSKDGTISETVVVREDREFVVGSSFIIIRFTRKSKADYYFYLLSSQVMKEQARMFVRGAGLPRISIFNVAKLNVINPSFHEQTAIAAYLDTKTAQIDRQIDLLDQKATQYSKLKQSLINETVTRGLDKSVPMKDSGVEWIGDIPEHWEVKRILDVANLYNGNSLNDDLKEIYSDNSMPCLPYIGTKDIDISTYKADVNNGVYIPNSVSGYKIAPANSTLLCIEGGSAGRKMAFVRERVCFVNKLLCFAVINTRAQSLYIHYFVRSTHFYSKFNTCLTGLKDNYWGVTGQQIRRFSVPIPPIPEQEEIAGYLEEKTAQIDRIVTTINTQIDKLKDLRKALINDVVTGKIKVVSEEQSA